MSFFYFFSYYRTLFYFQLLLPFLGAWHTRLHPKLMRSVQRLLLLELQFLRILWYFMFACSLINFTILNLPILPQYPDTHTFISTMMIICFVQYIIFTNSMARWASDTSRLTQQKCNSTSQRFRHIKDPWNVVLSLWKTKLIKKQELLGNQIVRFYCQTYSRLVKTLGVDWVALMLQFRRERILRKWVWRDLLKPC